MRRLSLFALALAFGALTSANAGAETVRQRNVRTHAQLEHELTVKRSWLDSGTVAPVGSMSRYMSDSTVYNHSPPYSSTTWRRSDFGDEVLPGPFDLPGFRGGPSF
jgi:hypothetical protein